MSRKTILILAPPRVTLQDVTGPWEVFCRAEAQRPGTYDVAVVSASAQKKVDTKFGLGIVCEHSVYDFAGDIDTVLVAGSEEGVSGEADPAFLDWLRDAETRTRRLGSICTGAFYLAHAGLLSGRQATSHWRYLQQLADGFPDISVQRDPIFVRDGDIYTSAGITAGIDLALALVETDCGHAVSQAVARDLVVFLQRQGDQPQLSTALALRMADRNPIRSLQQWMPDNLQSVARVEDMAAMFYEPAQFHASVQAADRDDARRVSTNTYRSGAAPRPGIAGQSGSRGGVRGVRQQQNFAEIAQARHPCGDARQLTANKLSLPSQQWVSYDRPS